MRRGFVTIALSLTACPAENPPPNIEAPTEKTEASSSDEGVRIDGVYEQLNVKKGPGDPVYNGRAGIRDGDMFWLLDTHDMGIRSPEELKKFTGKRVRVWAESAENHCTAWGDGNEASIVAPCLRYVQNIELLQ